MCRHVKLLCFRDMTFWTRNIETTYSKIKICRNMLEKVVTHSKSHIYKTMQFRICLHIVHMNLVLPIRSFYKMLPLPPDTPCICKYIQSSFLQWASYRSLIIKRASLNAIFVLNLLLTREINEGIYKWFYFIGAIDW